MKTKITISNPEKALLASGKNDENIRLLAENFNKLKIYGRGNEIIILGEDEKQFNKATKLINNIVQIVESGYTPTKADILHLIETSGDFEEIKQIYQSGITIPGSGKRIMPKTKTQREYVKAILENDIVIGIGPAGTGKTYLAMALALNSLLDSNVSRIILTRPVVEAGESLGYLPGKLEEKVNPYLRPLYDAIFDMLDYEKFERLVTQNKIEIAPLAYMRGRTLHDSFIILDEAQNTQPEQMKMVLTRFGINSKMVITGDITQIDLALKERSGLVLIQKILKNIDGIKFIYFSQEDVVRHPLVQKIVEAYEKLG